MQDTETEARREAVRIRYAGGAAPGHRGTAVAAASREDGNGDSPDNSPWLASWAASALRSMEAPADEECAEVRIPPLEFPPVTYLPSGQRPDRWVLACGWIAAAAAFAAAFVASGGMAAHPATIASTPAVIGQACSSAAP